MRRSRHAIGGAATAAAVLVAAVSALTLAAAPARAHVQQAGLAAGSAAAGTWRITTIAGGAGGPGPARRFAANACALTYAAGAIYLAGDISIGDSCGLAVDRHGNLLFADTGQDVFSNANGTDGTTVRVMAATSGTFYGRAMTAGDVYTIAGNGVAGFSGDGGPATSAELGQPTGLAVDPAGNVIIADIITDRVRVAATQTGTFYGQAMTAGDIYTIAGGGSTRLGDSGPARKVALGLLSGIALDRSGNVVFATPKAERVRLLAVTSGRFYGRRMRAGYVYTIAGQGTVGFGGDGGPAGRAQFTGLAGVAVDRAGNIVIADGPKIMETVGPDNRRLRVVAARTGTFYGVPMTAGDIYTIAGPRTTYLGEGAAATAALLFTGGHNAHQLGGVAASAGGSLAIADTRHLRIRLVPAVPGRRYGRPMRAGDIYTIAGDGRKGTSGNGGPGTRAELRQPFAVAFDGAGNVLLSTRANIRVVAAAAGTYYGRRMRAGNIYSIAGTGKVGYSGDGGLARSAEVAAPTGIAVDQHGNVVFSDTGNARVRVIAARSGRFYGRRMKSGHIYTIQLFSEAPRSVAVDPNGNIVLCDGTSGSNVVLVLAVRSGTFYGRAMQPGHLYLVAGGGDQFGDGVPATSALLGQAAAAPDGAGNLVIAELNSQTGLGGTRLRVVAGTTGTFYGQAMIAGDIYTIAGNGTHGTGDQGPAAQASFGRFGPGGAVTGSGAIVVADGTRSREIFDS